MGFCSPAETVLQVLERLHGTNMIDNNDGSTSWASKWQIISGNWQSAIDILALFNVSLFQRFDPSYQHSPVISIQRVP